MYSSLKTLGFALQSGSLTKAADYNANYTQSGGMMQWHRKSHGELPAIALHLLDILTQAVTKETNFHINGQSRIYNCERSPKLQTGKVQQQGSGAQGT